MDLTNLIPEKETTLVTLKVGDKVLENDDGTPMTIEVYLPHTKVYRAAKHKQTDTLLEKRKDTLKSSEAEALGIELLAETTKAWNITYNKDKPKFSVKKAIEIYDAIPQVPEQIIDEVKAQEGFTKA